MLTDSPDSSLGFKKYIIYNFTGNVYNLRDFFVFIKGTVYRVLNKGTPSLAGRSLSQTGSVNRFGIHPLRSA